MVPLEETSQALLDVLHRAGDEWGPLGVALAAAQLSDTDAVVDAICREHKQPIPDRLAKLSLGPDDVILMRGDGWEPLEGEPPPETVIVEWLKANGKHNLVARVGDDQDLLTLDEDAMRAAGWYRSPAYAINLPPDEDTRPLLVEGIEAQARGGSRLGEMVLEASERPWPWPDRHGWVVPLGLGVHARCGGPAICKACAAEQAESERRA